MSIPRIIVTVGLGLMVFLDAEWLGANRESTTVFLLALIALGLSLHVLGKSLSPSAPGIHFTPVHILCLVALVLLCLSTYRLGPWYLSDYYLLRYGLLLVLLLSVYQPDSGLDTDFVQKLFGVLVVAVALVWMGFSLIDLNWGRVDLNPEQGLSFTFGNRNHFAVFVMTGLFLSLPIWFNAKGAVSRVFGVLGVICGLILVVQSGSRGAYLQTLVFGGVFSIGAVLIHRKGKYLTKRAVFGALSAILLLLVLLLLVQDEEMWLRWRNDFMDGGDRTRLNLWSTSWQLAISSPLSFLFGSGSGYLFANSFITPTEGMAFEPSIAGAKHVHNEYLELLLEGGLVGLVLVLLPAVLLFKRLCSAVMDAESEMARRMQVLSLLCGLGAVAGFAAFSVATRYSSVLLPTVILLGVGLQVAGLQSFKLGLKSSRYIGFVLVGFCLWSLLLVAKQLIADHHYRAFSVAAESWRESSMNTSSSADPVKLEQFRAAAEFHLEEGLKYNPRHIHLLYRKHEKLLGRYQSVPISEIEAGYEAIDKLVPNFAGTWTKQAEYLISQGKMNKGLALAARAAEVNYYNIDLEIRLAFYWLLARDDEAFKDAIRRAIEKAVEAEEKFGSSGSIPNEERAAAVEKAYTVLITSLKSEERLTVQSIRQKVIESSKLLIESNFGADVPVFMDFFEVQN